MKILYIITKSNWGGAQRYVYDLATHFSREDGYEVAVALGGDGALRQKLEEKGVRVIQIQALERDIKITNDIRAFFALLNLLREETPDIVHLNSSKSGFLGALACFLYKRQETRDKRQEIVFTVHGWAFNEKRPWWQRVVLALLQWKTVLLSDRTIVVSHTLKAQVWWWPFVQGKLAVIHNGVPELSFFPRDAAITHFPNIRHTTYDIQIVTIAELHKNKGLDAAIEALSLMLDKNVTYTIIGEGEEREKLEMLIKWYELGDRIFLAGHMSEAYKYLKAFDLFLLPSRTEALSYTLLEAGRAGLPVVATAVGGIPEIVEHKKTGLLVPPENPHALAYALWYVNAHPVARALAGREFENATRKHFTLTRMLEETKNVYITCAASRV
ncbi:MAG: hypothetical protein A3D67_04230 [Candidatus Lloydbacteria bacterium RIFCSPHIGHO2_02_FULL_51_22]|uniref:Glycosyltransferase subfamily 4-like N-terminal domain-containing protein n=2 Tax=Candidatus Lloydiibacteriota TaxID=1817910 RepID=A0A1G2DG80_9BACT|nr:MAG: hypothetical protein A3D67_04230 [Candidatus Lloydbacteria bacterium RIFCSPHIGHO2_02_FULL_51_22]OGZ17338.1 MAG: hypothetical protein A3G11_00190 [Candidatus Lloydbacteria bacterium RIFCSPLOWO2_12_FULL_51_9]